MNITNNNYNKIRCLNYVDQTQYFAVIKSVSSCLLL